MWVRQRQPWGRFTVKLVVLVCVMSAGAWAFMDRYRFGMDPQEEKCIPGVTFYLIDRKDRTPVKNKTFVFRAEGIEPIFPDGTQMVKYIRGTPGDTVEVRADETVVINGVQVGQGLSQSEKLGVSHDQFVGQGTIAKDEYWFMGTSDLSFDSRYWGTVQKEQIVGRAYPIF